MEVDVAPLERDGLAEAEPGPGQRQHEREVSRPVLETRREELRELVGSAAAFEPMHFFFR